MDTKAHLETLFAEVSASLGADRVSANPSLGLWSVEYGEDTRVDIALEEDGSVVRFAVSLPRPAAVSAGDVHVLLLRYNAVVEPGVGLFAALTEDGTPLLCLDRAPGALDQDKLSRIIAELAKAHDAWSIALAKAHTGSDDLPDAPAGGIRV